MCCRHCWRSGCCWECSQFFVLLWFWWILRHCWWGVVVVLVIVFLFCVVVCVFVVNGDLSHNYQNKRKQKKTKHNESQNHKNPQNHKKKKPTNKQKRSRHNHADTHDFHEIFQRLFGFSCNNKWRYYCSHNNNRETKNPVSICCKPCSFWWPSRNTQQNKKTKKKKKNWCFSFVFIFEILIFSFSIFTFFLLQFTSVSTCLLGSQTTLNESSVYVTPAIIPTTTTTTISACLKQDSGTSSVSQVLFSNVDPDSGLPCLELRVQSGSIVLSFGGQLGSTQPIDSLTKNLELCLFRLTWLVQQPLKGDHIAWHSVFFVFCFYFCEKFAFCWKSFFPPTNTKKQHKKNQALNIFFANTKKSNQLQVVLYNSLSSPTSSTFTVSVTQSRRTITTHPTNQTQPQLGTYTTSVSAVGAVGSMTYSWLHNDELMSGKVAKTKTKNKNKKSLPKAPQKKTAKPFFFFLQKPTTTKKNEFPGESPQQH